MVLIPEQTALIFPGQGSQELGMGAALSDAYPLARRAFEQADEWLDVPLTRIAWEGPESELNETINTQPALMVHSIASLRVFQEVYPGLRPAFVAGHSMGELSALVAGEALLYEDALRLVRRRGELMKRAGDLNPGGMAAIIGLDIPTLEQICVQASTPDEVVQVANDNCPGQVVISGARTALERAVLLAQEAKARKAVILPISIAAHSPLMLNAQQDFNQAVNSSPIAVPSVPIIANVTAQSMRTPQDIRNDLQAQLTARVRWTESVQLMVNQGVNTFIEIGSGSVLCGLIKRIDRQVRCLSLGTPADFEALSALS
jgi:[acyl-carrier-protein] S-malonyltransferase